MGGERINAEGVLAEATVRRPTLAVWKFTSCDGCQLTLLDCEDELLTLAGEVEVAHFLEASREVSPGPYDVSLVEVDAKDNVLKDYVVSPRGLAVAA